jgi:DNA-binding transcriptional regulator YiaG
VLPAVIEFLGYDPLPAALSFADLLRRSRHSRGLDQRGLARALSIPFNTLRCWERGSFEPKPARKALIEERLAALA